MSVLYQGRCSACGHAGEGIPWGYQALVLDEGRLVPLVSPQEAKILREHGTTFFRAGLRGRYARVTHRICMECGSRGEQAILGFPFTTAGCLLVVVVLSVLALGGSLARVPTWLMPFIGVGAWVFLTWGAARLVRILYRSRQAVLPAGKHCDSCGSKQMRDVAASFYKDLPCPACGAKSYRVHPVERE